MNQDRYRWVEAFAGFKLQVDIRQHSERPNDEADLGNVLEMGTLAPATGMLCLALPIPYNLILYCSSPRVGPSIVVR
jgi:hypothetical protein